MLVAVGSTLLVLQVAAGWRLHQKGGYPGWTALVPGGRFRVRLALAGRSPRWQAVQLAALITVLAQGVFRVTDPLWELVGGPTYNVLLLASVGTLLALQAFTAVALAAAMGLARGVGVLWALCPPVVGAVLAFGPAEFRQPPVFDAHAVPRAGLDDLLAVLQPGGTAEQISRAT